MNRESCPECKGKGYIQYGSGTPGSDLFEDDGKEKCNKCKGKGEVKTNKKLSLRKVLCSTR